MTFWLKWLEWRASAFGWMYEGWSVAINGSKPSEFQAALEPGIYKKMRWHTFEEILNLVNSL